MAYDPNDPLEMIKAEARDEGMDVSDDAIEERHVAARAMLAALQSAEKALSHLNGYHTTTMAAKIADAIAQAEAAGIKAEG